MKKALHAKSVNGCNLMTSLTVAHEAGFKGIEIVASKLADYLDQGFTAEDLAAALKARDLVALSINDICHIESPRPEALEKMLEEAKRYSEAAEIIGCKHIQLVPLVEMNDNTWEEILEVTSSNVKKICDIGAEHGVSFQLEAVAWSPFRSLKRGLALIERVGKGNLGMVVDTWHFWAAGETTPEEVANMDPSLIYNIHFCDGKKGEEGTVWDETDLRGYYFGEADIPLKEYADAIKASGYDGWWSVELVSSKHWEMDAAEVAKRLSNDLNQYM
jgi:sugar phosphate isomerase/epimerase